MKKNKWVDFFDKIFVLNLPFRQDRLREISIELSQVDISLESDVIVYPAARPAEKGKYPSIGARGCFAGHLAMLKAAAQVKAKSVLIIEDDLAIEPDWHQSAENYIAALESQPWDIVYFGYDLLEEVQGKGFIRWDKAVRALHFYAINATVLPKLIAFLELVDSREPGDPLGGPMHVDGALNTFRQQHPEVKTLLAVPCLGFQRPSRTDIADLRFYDKLPILKQFVAYLRRFKASRSKTLGHKTGPL